MDCQPMFLWVYFSLLLMTAGFVLTLCSWLAPPLNSFVLGVRILGLVGLMVGGVFLGCACLVGSLNRGKCCAFCYVCNKRHKMKQEAKLYCEAEVIVNPIVTGNCTYTDTSVLCSEHQIEKDTVKNHVQYTTSGVNEFRDYGSCGLSQEQNLPESPSHSENRNKSASEPLTQSTGYNTTFISDQPTNSHGYNCLKSNTSTCRDAVLIVTENVYDKTQNSNHISQKPNIQSNDKKLNLSNNNGFGDRDYEINPHPCNDGVYSYNNNQTPPALRVLKAHNRESMSYDDLPIYQFTDKQITAKQSSEITGDKDCDRMMEESVNLFMDR